MCRFVYIALFFCCFVLLCFSELELSCAIAQCVSGYSVNLSYAQYNINYIDISWEDDV